MKNIITFPILLLSLSMAFGQWSESYLSTYKEVMGAVVEPGTSNFWFAGGSTLVEETDEVEIYHASTGTWTYSNLSMARSFPTGAAYGKLIFFAGGQNWLTGVPTSRVDIWDGNTGEWSTAELSVPRFELVTAAAAGKVLFVGGTNFVENTSYNVVDIYDVETKQWSSTTLSGNHSPISSAVVETVNGPIALFAGGGDINFNTVTDQVSIYDFNTATWSTASLSQARSFIAATVLGDKVLFAGGMKADNTPSDRVDIFNATTGEWTTAQLSSPRGLFKYGATVCGKAYFVGGGVFDIVTNEVYSSSNVIDIYDPITDSWDHQYFDRELLFHAVLSDGDRLLIAGGRDISQSQIYRTVDIYTCPTNAITDEPTGVIEYRIYPNPNNGNFYVERMGSGTGNPALAKIYNTVGELVCIKQLSATDERISLNLPAGTYFVLFVSEDRTQVEKVIVQ